jgi:8-oxo-dGTP pyrophosphatase MutT (NUDIX family)
MSKEAAPTIPAATILLCNDRPEGIETFMVVRHHQIDFASGALVFPGGKVASEDGIPEVEALCDGVDTIPEGHLAFMVAAIREAFEESGVLLARQNGSSNLIGPEALALLEHYRDPLAKGDQSLLEFLRTEKLRLALDTLTHYAHWITPANMPKRFDTQFYIADAPEGQVAIHDGSESVDSVWITAQQLLKEADLGKWTIIFPTRCNIELLATQPTIVDMKNWCNDHGIVTILPSVEKQDDGIHLGIPKESGYPTTSTIMDLNMRG